MFRAALALKRAGELLANATIAVSALAAAAPAVAANNHPIVLVHGFLGFGPNELQGSGFKYWGSFNDIEAGMKTYNGAHQVFTATVGPVSSNWDRAVELYYQIKGGCADYGEKQTAKYAAYGKIRKPAGCKTDRPMAMKAAARSSPAGRAAGSRAQRPSRRRTTARRCAM